MKLKRSLHGRTVTTFFRTKSLSVLCLNDPSCNTKHDSFPWTLSSPHLSCPSPFSKSRLFAMKSVALKSSRALLPSMDCLFHGITLEFIAQFESLIRLELVCATTAM